MTAALAASLVIGVLAAALGWAARRRRGPRARLLPRAAEPLPLDSAGATLAPGDVVSIRGKDHWLEHGWRVTDGREPVATIWFCDGSALLRLELPTPQVLWGPRVDPTLARGTPATVELARERFHRRRRLPVQVEPLGNVGAPGHAIYVEYAARRSTGALVAILAEGEGCAARVDPVSAGDLEFWGGGDATFR